MRQSESSHDLLMQSLIHLSSLAIGRMFGGIPEAFYTTYHEYLPKSEPRDQYELRQELYQLYHYLNHTVLFGVSSDYILRRVFDSAHATGSLRWKCASEDGRTAQRSPVRMND